MLQQTTLILPDAIKCKFLRTCMILFRNSRAIDLYIVVRKRNWCHNNRDETDVRSKVGEELKRNGEKFDGSYQFILLLEDDCYLQLERSL
jgi:hypothetical protein